LFELTYINTHGHLPDTSKTVGRSTLGRAHGAFSPPVRNHHYSRPNSQKRKRITPPRAKSAAAIAMASKVNMTSITLAVDMKNPRNYWPAKCATCCSQSCPGTI